MSNVVEMARPVRTNQDALEMAEGILARVKSGEVVALAAVEVHADRAVTIECSEGWAGSYHLLNSGAARLANRLAGSL